MYLPKFLYSFECHNLKQSLDEIKESIESINLNVIFIVYNYSERIIKIFFNKELTDIEEQSVYYILK
jgi:hypothetical protein